MNHAIQIAICEDNQEYATAIRQVVEGLFSIPDLSIFPFNISTFHTGEALIASEIQYDLIIQDIDLGPGMSGFAVAQWVNKNYGIQPKIIILTNVIDPESSHDVKAAGYVIKKPNDFKRLEATVSTQIKEITKTDGVSVKIVSSNEMYFNFNQIRYISKYQNDTVIHTACGQEFYCTLTLNNWLERLPQKQFLKTHKSFIINMSYAVGFSENKKQIILHKALKNEFVKAIPSNHSVLKNEIRKFETRLGRGML